MEPVAVGLHGGQDALLQGQGHHLPPLQGGRHPLDPDELALAGGAAGHLSGGDAFDFVYLAAIDILEQKACGFMTIVYHSTPWHYSTTAL